MPCPPMQRSSSWMFRTRHAVSANAKGDIVDVSDTACRVPTTSLHLSHFRFPFVIPQLCPSKLGGRAKRRGYVKKNRERMSGERGNIPPSGALLLVPLTQRDKVDGHLKLETGPQPPLYSVICTLSSVLYLTSSPSSVSWHLHGLWQSCPGKRDRCVWCSPSRGPSPR